MTLLTLPCTSHHPIFSGRYGGITYDPSTNTIYYTGKSIDFDEIFEKSHFPTSSTPPTKSPKHQKYIVSNSGYGESDGEQMKSSNLSLQSLYSLSLETYEIEKMEGTESCFNPVYTEKVRMFSKGLVIIAFLTPPPFPQLFFTARFTLLEILGNL